MEDEEFLDTRRLPPNDPEYTGPDPMSGIAGVDHSPLGAALMISPAGRVVTGAVNQTKTAIDIGKKVWQSPSLKGVRTSDFIQNLGKPSTRADLLQKTVKPIEQVGNAIDEVLSIPSMQLARISRLNKNAGFKGKDLVENFGTIQDILNESSINFEDKGGFLNVDNWTIPQGYLKPRQSAVSKIGGTHWKGLQEIDKLRLTEILTNLDDYHQRGLQGQNQKWTSQKPTRGFPGNRVVTTSNGIELGIAWDGGNQSYRLFDVQKARNRALDRYQADKPGDDWWSKLTAAQRKKTIKVQNKDALTALDRIKNDHPNLYLDILGSIDQPDTVWTVEHINSRSSGVWDKDPDGSGKLKHKFKKKSDGSPLYFGDSENLMPATGTNYGRLKTNMENHLTSLPSNDINSGLYIDINPKTRNFFLAKKSDGKPWSHPNQQGKIVEINGMTRSGKWKEILYHVLDGGDEIGIVDSMIDNPGDQAIRLETGDFGRTSPNTRLEPNNQVTDYEPTYEERIFEQIDKHPDQVKLRGIFESMLDHESGVEPLDPKTYRRYSRILRREILQKSIFDK
tara:strand:+ start:60 stop:1751 length:1692 start_codon:yes stop_codon:yes gene_type:complete